MNDKVQKRLMIIALLLIVLLLATGTYAWLRITKTSEKINRIRVGDLSLKLDNESADGINLLKEVPKSYAQGINNQEYNFEVTNDGNVDSQYRINLNNLAKYVPAAGEEITLNASNRLSDGLIRIMLLKNNDAASPEKTRLLSDGTGRILDSGIIQPHTTIKYSLKLWIDSKAGDNNTQVNVMDKLFSGQIVLTSEQV